MIRVFILFCVFVFGGETRAVLLNPAETAVIIVDIQGDFTDTSFLKGSMAVPGADDAYVKAANVATERLKDKGYLIVATQDFHPQNHVSYASSHPGKKVGDVIKVKGPDGITREQRLWKDHCKEETPGAEVLITASLINKVVPKGMNLFYDSYSGFKDDNGTETGLNKYLQDPKPQKIKNLIIFGIATDYCVNATVLHALEAGYTVYVIEDLLRGLEPKTSEDAIRDMKSNGAVFVKTVQALFWKDDSIHSAASK